VRHLPPRHQPPLLQKHLEGHALRVLQSAGSKRTPPEKRSPRGAAFVGPEIAAAAMRAAMPTERRRAGARAARARRSVRSAGPPARWPHLLQGRGV
jgi:hypothetical protein